MIVRTDDTFEEGAVSNFGNGDGRFVGLTGGIGYMFGDYIQFGAATYDAVETFEGVKTELPFAGIRIKDSTGQCISANPIDPTDLVFSDEFETMKLGVNRIISCNLAVVDAADVDAKCGNMNIEYLYSKISALPVYGVANLDTSKDWVINNDSPSTGAIITSGTCTFRMPVITIVYQKFGYQNNFRYKIMAMDYEFKDR